MGSVKTLGSIAGRDASVVPGTVVASFGGIGRWSKYNVCLSDEMEVGRIVPNQRRT